MNIDPVYPIMMKYPVETILNVVSSWQSPRFSSSNNLLFSTYRWNRRANYFYRREIEKALSRITTPWTNAINVSRSIRNFFRESLSLSLSLSLWISTATRTLGNGRTIAFLRSNRLFRRYGNAYTVYVCIDVPKRKILSRVRCIIKPREYGVPISRSRLFSFSFSLSLSVSLSPGQALFRFRPWPCPHPVPMQSNYSLLDAPTGKCR